MRTILFYVAFIIGVSYVKAQTGNVQGTVTDESGLYVPGANIFISDIGKGGITDFDGRYVIVGLPEGEHTIEISYLGYAKYEETITVAAGATKTVNVTLIPKGVDLQQVDVFGFSGQAKALNKQKNNLNITNVVSTDQIGKFPDANIGDAVKRIPGITMQVDQGEARNVIVRGLSPQLNSVTLNGSRIPSAEGDNRNIQMDLIPSDMIQTIEVSKAVTPDMDGDALGGAINLVTRTSPQSFRLSAKAGSGINFITNKRILDGSFLLGDRSKNGKFGWMIGATITDNDFGSDNIEFEWTDEAESPLTGEDITVDPYIAEHDIRTYLVQRIRRSFSANFDYRIDADNSLFFKSMYNWRDDRENRYRLRYRSIEPIFADASETITGYQGEIRRQTKGGIDNNRNKNTRLEDQRMQNYSIGGDHLFGKVKIDWMGSFANASETRDNERYIEYELEETEGGNPIPFNVNLSDSEFPVITAVNPADVSLNRFGLREITEENQFTKEDDVNFFANVEIPANIAEQGTVKFGIRSRFKEKTRENNFFEYGDVTDAFATLSDQQLTDQTDSNFLAGSEYVAGQYVDPAFLGSFNLKDSNLFQEDELPEEVLADNFTVSEDVFAGYLMTEQKVSDKFSTLVGVRLENTSLTSEGNELTFNDDGDFVGSRLVTDENSYLNVLPSVHLKYNANDNTVIRAAWTNTLARPNYIDIVPRAQIVTEDEEISIGNPELDPTTSMNFDLNAEYYLNNVGIISVGGFYKKLDNFIYTFQTQTTDNSFGADTEGFNLFQPLNGDDASILGAEVALQAPIVKNVSLYLNYTFITSDANGIRNEDGDERTDVDLPNTAPNMFNGSLAYANNKFTARASLNFSDAYIDEVGGNAFGDRYYDQQVLVDFNATYAINKNLRIYADLNNITNQPLRYYQGVSERSMQVEFYERRLTFGLKYDLIGK